MKINKKTQIIISIIIFSLAFVIIFLNKNALKSVYGISNQKVQLSYTTIERLKEECKLITAKKQMDFITIMDGKDGRYLSISTYEVKSGIDFNKEQSNNYQVEIFSSDIIHNIEYRTEAEKNQNQEDFRNQISPLEKAYRQKAVDYAIEYGILEQAKERAEAIFNQMKLDSLKSENQIISIPESKQIIKLPYLPLQLELTNKSSVGEDTVLEQFDNCKIKKLPDNQFNRDSLILQNDIMNWEIRIGDTGMEIKDSFANVFKNVLKTNANEKNKGKDNVQLFRYFDPLYHKKIEVFSYSSDYYRTFFLNYGGRIYYLDAGDKISEQTLIDYVSPIMVYLASSIHPITNEKVNGAEEYKTYTTNYYKAARNLRDEFKEKRTRFELGVENLIKSNTLEDEGQLTQDEKYFAAFSDIEMFGRTEANNDILKTNNKSIDEKAALFLNLKTSIGFESVEEREAFLRKADSFEDSIVGEYLRAYFIQNLLKFNIKDDEKNKFLGDLKTGTKIASRILLSELSDSERNEYFRNIFKTRFSESLSYKDTALSYGDNEQISYIPGDNLLFYYYDLPDFSDHHTDGEIYARIKKMNNDKDITNAFVLVFNTKQFDFGLLDDNDIHAIVLDDATLRFFPNVASLNAFEKTSEFIETSFSRYTQCINDVLDTDIGKYLKALDPRICFLAYGSEKINENLKKNSNFFYYGDWKKLQIDPTNLKINNVSIGSIKLTKKGKSSYRDTNDYSQKSVIATVISDLQHSYSSEDADYYYTQLCAIIKSAIRDEIYKEVFRPSPRMVFEYENDANKRINW